MKKRRKPRKTMAARAVESPDPPPSVIDILKARGESSLKERILAGLSEPAERTQPAITQRIARQEQAPPPPSMIDALRKVGGNAA